MNNSLLEKNNIFYKVWIQGDNVYGEVYKIIKTEQNYCYVVDRKNKKYQMLLSSPDIIRNKKDAIERYYNLKKLLLNKHTLPQVKINDTIEIIIDDIEILNLKIAIQNIQYKPIFSGKPWKRIDYVEEILPNHNIGNNIISDNSPLGKSILNKFLYEKCFYQVDNIYHYVVINKIN